MLARYMLDHPRSVGETYFGHMRVAASFGIAMATGAGACFVHALVPRLCERTASRTIERLHDHMVRNRVSPEARQRLQETQSTTA